MSQPNFQLGRRFGAGLACLLFWAMMVGPVAAKGPTYTDPKQADADFAIQGEYQGTIRTADGNMKGGIQVIALGDGKFRAQGYPGGLPGDGWIGEKSEGAEGRRVGEVVQFEKDGANAEIRDGSFRITHDGVELGALPKVERRSPTLEKKPPADATILFDGSGTDAWKDGKMTDDGLLMAGTTSKQMFGDCKVHIEFRLPYQPQDRGQARGNSGIYMQGRYEIQMLDSFGLEGKQNECGGLYSVKEPDVNMCFPPLAWQTYDIEYRDAKYDEAGKVTAPPRITVLHNGVKIHDNVELPADRGTTAAPVKPGPADGPIYLQNHGNPVRYRNIWVTKLE